MEAVVFVWIDRHRSTHSTAEALEIAQTPARAGHIIAAVIPGNKALEDEINRIIDKTGGD